MRIGVVLPFTEAGGAPLRPESIARAAERIEAAGIDSAWCFDAVGRGFKLPEPLTALAVAGTVTNRIELGTCVLQLPLRNAAGLANQASTVQLMTGGRLLLGLGAGSTADDFALHGIDFEARFRDLKSGLARMTSVWEAEEKAGQGWPAAKRRPQVLIGSWSGSRWLPRAAKDFDGWIGSGAKTDWAAVGEGIRRFRVLGGKRAVLTNVATDIGGERTSSTDPNDHVTLHCGRAEAADRVARIAALGFDDLVLVPRRHDAAALEEIRSLAP